MQSGEQFRTSYGYFDSEHDEYVITRPDTPRPWINVVCPGDYGFVLSQAGGGYSWRTHASLNRLTRWDQDLLRDNSGRFLYVRDDESGQFWSAAWQPVQRPPDRYQVRHGIGYSVIESTNEEIATEWTLFVPPGEPLEIWRLRVQNRSDRPRRLSLFTYFEWLLGAAPDWHREFHKTFIETAYDEADGVLWATKHLWELPNRQGQHWNRSWGYFAFHSASEPPAGYDADKESFVGPYRTLAAPRGVAEVTGETLAAASSVAPAGTAASASPVGAAGSMTPTGVQGLENRTGRWGDAIGSLHHHLTLAPGESHTLVYLLGAAARDEREQALAWVRRYRDPAQVEEAWQRTRRFWQKWLATPRLHTPDEAFNLLTNTWLKYQALSARLWGRTAYYQAGGAYGFRDQLQDSQIFLEIDPAKTQEQIRLHAAHQFRAGNVLHWWHPLSEQGLANQISDNRLWLVFVTLNYLKETRDWAFIDEELPYRDGGSGPLYEHCLAAIDYTLARRSARGLPLIGEGDWNDGMNAVGFDGRGESVWLGQFLYGIVREFGLVAAHRQDQRTAARLQQEAATLREAVNRYGWDGEWYLRATCDDGTPLGSAGCRHGRIFLNAQTWAIINGLAEEGRTVQLLNAIRRQLLTPYGPVLLAPAYGEPDERIGYLTRYAPGVRENGGVYMHAAVWAIWAAVKAKDAALAWQLYRSICPVQRGMNPDLYKVEPYVTPGNVDGPDSPHQGRGGWTWYTGSAAWLFRVSLEWLLGVRPAELDEPDGLYIDPCIPPEWDGFQLERRFRGALCHIRVNNPDHVSQGVRRVVLDGVEWPDLGRLPEFAAGTEHDIQVTLGG
ncbi:MAG: glycosyl transferase family 36 [Limnochordaceae bacterium]|nr:glycosyl transferase family 36 [Limnochordaceae bacterium]